MMTRYTLLYSKFNGQLLVQLSQHALGDLCHQVAAALLLTSCGIIFCNEIHEVFKELFASITFEGNESNLSTIEEVYELGYIPEGYYFEEEMITPLCIQRKFVNENGDVIRFEQRVLDGTDFTVDSEIGYSKILEVQKYDVYYRENAERYSCSNT